MTLEEPGERPPMWDLNKMNKEDLYHERYGGSPKKLGEE